MYGNFIRCWKIQPITMCLECEFGPRAARRRDTKDCDDMEVTEVSHKVSTIRIEEMGIFMPITIFEKSGRSLG